MNRLHLRPNLTLLATIAALLLLRIVTRHRSGNHQHIFRPRC